MLSALRTLEKGKGRKGDQEEEEEQKTKVEVSSSSSSSSARAEEKDKGTPVMAQASVVHSEGGGDEGSELVLFKGDQLRTSAQYRSSDPIQNLRVRVRARQVRGPTNPAEGDKVVVDSVAAMVEVKDRDAASASVSTSDKGGTGSEDIGYDDEESLDDHEEGEEATKWTSQDVSWQQKIYDSETIRAAKHSTQALENHLRGLFGMAKAGKTSPEKEKRFQEVCKRYKDDIINLRATSLELDDASSEGEPASQMYTYVDYEDSMRRDIADDVGEVAQEAITTASEGPEYDLSCGLNVAESCLPNSRDAPGAKERRKRTKGARSCRLQQTMEKRAQSMTIVAVVHGEQIVLAQLRYFQNGVLEMRPGFSDSSSNNGKSTVFFAETPKGALIEYTLENASAPHQDSELIKSMFGMKLSQKARKKSVPVNPPTALKKAGLSGPFMSLQDRYGFNGSVLSFNLLLEIVGGKNFMRDNLYVEYFVHLPRAQAASETRTPAPGKAGGVEDIWQMEGESAKLAKGVTQVSSYAKYPTPSFIETGRHNDKILNWCFPVELTMTACKEAANIEDKEWPVVIFTIYSYDRWDRSTCEGFCRLQLNPDSLGTKCHYLQAWKPQGSLRQQMKESFTGGIIQPQDMHGLYDYLVNQKLNSPLVTTCEGTLKIRTNLVLQKQVENVRMSKNLTRSISFTPAKTRASKTSKMAQAKSVAAKLQSHTLLEITERARERIRVLREKNNKMNM